MARGSLAGKSIVCTTTVMELLEMGKDIKITHSVSSRLPKNGGTFFLKKLCMGEQFFWQIYERMFYMETTDQIMQGGGKVSQMNFPVI